MGRGFAFSRRFKSDKNMASSIARNNRELSTFLNSYAVTEDDDGNVDLDGGLTVAEDLTVTGATVLAQEDWTTPTLLVSWVDYGGGYQGARYRKDSDGVVHIQGRIKSGVGGDPFVLDGGYRPGADLVFSGTASGTTDLRIRVRWTGTITLSNWSATWTDINCSFAT